MAWIDEGEWLVRREGAQDVDALITGRTVVAGRRDSPDLGHLSVAAEFAQWRAKSAQLLVSRTRTIEDRPVCLANTEAKARFRRFISSTSKLPSSARTMMSGAMRDSWAAWLSVYSIVSMIRCRSGSGGEIGLGGEVKSTGFSCGECDTQAARV